jgi:tRNA threonylcarbamoyladenosine biosynthesis protein TsaB
VTKLSDSSAPLILAIDTATRAGSVALARGRETVCLMTSDNETSHSIDLLANVEAALHSAHAKLSDVDLFAAASGPGSFTGLRIGLATVKSFAMSAGRDCVGVPTLAAVAHAAGDSERTAALIPAGRGEVFAQLFSVAGDDVHALDQAMYISPKAVLERYEAIERLTWAGEGANLNPNIRDSAGSNGGGWRLAPPSVELARSIAALAFSEYERGRTTSAEQLHAIYVRPSDAEINEQWSQKK